jgi:hypothetical protein
MLSPRTLYSLSYKPSGVDVLDESRYSGGSPPFFEPLPSSLHTSSSQQSSLLHLTEITEADIKLLGGLNYGNGQAVKQEALE